MLYFIYGKDSFRSGRYFLKVKDFYQSKTPAIFYCDFTDKAIAPPDISVIEEALKSKTLFSGSRLMILKNVLQNTGIQFRNDLLDILKKYQVDKVKDLMIIFYENDEVLTSSLQKWLREKAQGVKEFPLLKKNELVNWTIKEEQKLGIKLSSEARETILLSFSSDTGSIYHSLKKLSLIKKGFLDKELVEANLFLPMSSTIFIFLDYLAKGDSKQALWLLEILLDQGLHPLYILKMIVFEFRNLLMIKNASAKPSTMHPFVFRKLLPLSKMLSEEILRAAYLNLLDYDKRIKEGSIDGKIGLEMFLVDFSEQKCNTI
jgi:DNA polymerase III delta subunit